MPVRTALLFCIVVCGAFSFARGTASAAPKPALRERYESFNPVSSYALPPFYASAVALLDAGANRWLVSENAHEPRAMASTTKIMTAYVALTLGANRLNDLVTVDQETQDLGTATGSKMGLIAGERVSLHDLLYGLLLPSGNDAALAIAKAVAGSVPAFAGLMNAAAQRLGLTHTHYMNPDGLDDPGQYASARDLVVLARATMALPLFQAIVASQHMTIAATAAHHAYVLTNVNWFIQWYPGADGVKPGYTGAAGLCQVVSVHRHGRWLIGALLNTSDLHTDVRDLMNFGFGDFTWASSHQPGDTPAATITEKTGVTSALYFPLTGHRVRAGFLAYFEAHGGSSTFGSPLTDEFVENGLTIQYFDSLALWWNPGVQAVTVMPLGARFVPRAAMLRAAAPLPSPRVLYVAATGHNIYGEFLYLYRSYGPGLLGYPLTEAMPAGRRTEQYFTNAVLTWKWGETATLKPLGDLDLRRRGLL